MSTTTQNLSLDPDEAAAVREHADRTTWSLCDGGYYFGDAVLMLADAQKLTHAALLVSAAAAGALPAEYLDALADAIPRHLRDVRESLYDGGLDAEYRERLSAVERGFVSLAARLEVTA